jgi:hypothetical protein
MQYDSRVPTPQAMQQHGGSNRSKPAPRDPKGITQSPNAETVGAETTGVSAPGALANAPRYPF